MMVETHTLSWGMVVKTRHGDDVRSWPKVARLASSAAMERGKQAMREKRGEFEFVSQRSSCTETGDGGFQLFVEITIRMTGAA